MTTDPFARLGAYIYRVRWFVLAAWLVVLVICGPFAPKAADALQAGGIEAPGSDSSMASNLLSSEFDVSALNNVAVVLHSDSLTIDDAKFESRSTLQRCASAERRASRASSSTTTRCSQRSSARTSTRRSCSPR